MSQTIKINSEEFTLHPSGAICWNSKNMLLIADVHFGKVAHFRKHGSAVPAKVSFKNFEKLDELVTECKPNTICFLGDLFHSKLNNDWNNFVDWVRRTEAKIILISGNHDIIPNYMFEELGITVYNKMRIDGFLLTHHPTEDENDFNFSGHIHPGIRMQGVGRQVLKLSCFYKTERQMILPAFGNFTGKHILEPSQNDAIYAIVEGEVVCVSEKK